MFKNVFFNGLGTGYISYFYWDSDSMISMLFPLEFRGLKKTQYGPTNGPTDRPTDGQTDRRTDRPSYRDAWTHLKTKKKTPN